MILHKYTCNSSLFYTLFDEAEQVVQHPTFYLRHLRKFSRPKTSQKHIAETLKKFCQWIETRDEFNSLKIDQVIESLVQEDIINWIIYQRENGNTEVTINNREVLIREFYKWLTTSDAGRVITAIPWSNKTVTKRPHKRLPRFVTSEQVIKLLKGLHNESQRVALHFMYDTGVRISELVRMPVSSLPDEDGSNYYPLIVSGSKAYDGSEFKYRYTIISRPVLARVRRYHSTYKYLLTPHWDISDPSKPIFLNIYGKALSIYSVQKMIADAWRRQGGKPGQMSPHRLRHGTALSILQSELGKEQLDKMAVVKSMFGHNDIRTTETYGSVPIKALQTFPKNTIKQRYDEAQRIYDLTYLSSHMHIEKRGHFNEK